MSILIRPGLTNDGSLTLLVWLYLMTSLHVTLRQVVTWTFMNNLEHVNDPVLKAFTRKSPFDPLKRLTGIFFTYWQLEETFFDLFQIGSKTVICQAFPIPLCLIALMDKKPFLIHLGINWFTQVLSDSWNGSKKVSFNNSESKKDPR